MKDRSGGPAAADDGKSESDRWLPGESRVQIPGSPHRRVQERVLDLVFPPRCVGCTRSGAWICTQCWPRVPWLRDDQCPRCGRASPTGISCRSCSRLSNEMDAASSLRVRALARHEGIARKAIHELKYTQHYNIATVLGAVMALRTRAEATLVPVPLHRSRRRSRGFNQSELLAKEIARAMGMPIVTDRLRRDRKTRDQITLDGAQRKANVAGAFTWTGPRLEGRLLLIDDVTTTGATLHACLESMALAGMTDVEALVFASAPAPGASNRGSSHTVSDA